MPVAYLTPALSLRRGGMFTLNFMHSRFLRIFLLQFSYCLLSITSFSQSPTVQTFIDKKDILIGEQLVLTVKTTFPVNSQAKNFFLTIPDSIPHFDIVGKSEADTITYKDESTAIEQKLTFTSFDSGAWVLPAFDVQFNKGDRSPLEKLRTDSFDINVTYSPADSTNQLRDIKPIMEVKVADYTWLYITVGIILLFLLIFLIWRYLKNKKRKPKTLVQSKLSPYEEAMQELEKLNKYDLLVQDEVKQYHIGLSDIFKRYLGRKQNKNLANHTTGDLLINMANHEFNQEAISALATALRCNDAVKFAKYIPANFESTDCLSKIKETLNLIEQKTLNPKS